MLEVHESLMDFYRAFFPHITSEQKEVGLLTLMHYLNDAYGNARYLTKYFLLEFVKTATPMQIERVIKQIPECLKHGPMTKGLLSHQALILDLLTSIVANDKQAGAMIAAYSNSTLDEMLFLDPTNALTYRLLNLIQDLYAAVYEPVLCESLETTSNLLTW